MLRRQLDAAAEMGFTCYTHPEVEFYLLDSDRPDSSGSLHPADQVSYFDHLTGSVSQDLRRHTVNMLEAVGISVEFSHNEVGPGQHEIDLRYADALTMADNMMTFRTIVKEVALQHGKYATFMPKPFSDHPGSAMHTHFSLFEGDTNAFYAANTEFNLSATARQFIAGVLTHAPEITAVTNQFVNSYKRLWGGEAPSHVSWGHNNRSALLRVPLYKPNKGGSARVEFRGIDSAANPYLAYAAVIGAYLRGIREGYELPDPTSEDVWSLTSAERRAMDIKPLPGTLHEALRQMEDSELVAEILGEQLFEIFLRNKRQEWDAYRVNVSPFEVSSYLGAV